MSIVKQSVARSLPVILILSSDGQSPKTGATEGQMTLSYRKEGASSWSAKTATDNWTEVGKGVYLIDWSASDLDTLGRFDVVAEHADSINYYGSVTVSANLLDDVASTLAALNDVTAAEVETAIAAIHGAGNYEGAAVAPTVAEIAEGVHDIKVTFNKTTGVLTVLMADDTPLTSVTITDTATEVTRA